MTNRSLLLLYVVLCFSLSVRAQDPAALIDEGRKLEQKLKEEEALEQYKRAAIIQPSNTRAINKCAELCASIGARQADAVSKMVWYQQALRFAEASEKADSNAAEPYYLKAVAYGKLTEVEKDKDKLVKYVREIKINADKAISKNAQYGKAYHALGKWHLEVLELNPVKKAALKLLYGSLPNASVAEAISLMEKCRQMEQYYCLNYLDLAKAYHFDKKYEKAINTLEQLAKLPTRRQDDVAIKAEGAALLQKLQ